MKSFALLAVAAAACLALAGCTTASPSAAITKAQTAVSQVDPVTVRVAAEVAFDASVNGLEISLQAGSLTGQTKIDARTGLLAGHVALVVGRSSFVASGVASTPELDAQIKLTDTDYQRVVTEFGT